MLYYREAVDGQLLEEGITEAGAIASWTAAATAYSVHGFPMLPFYIYYSMFGFQRVGDLIWAAADQRARGFLIGATAGRTTLGGEGLQHQDGSSHLVASAVPNCRAYDPAYAYEIAVIVERGARRMMEEGADEFYYVTAMNEPYAQPSAPEGVEDAIMKGMYRLRKSSGEAEVRLLGSGAILPEVVIAADLLEQEWGVSVEVLSVTSFSELAREAREVERERLLNPERSEQLSHVETLLPGSAPIVAATDYVRAYPQLIASYVAAPFVALGTDGFGRSDTRARLRNFFGVDRNHIVVATLGALARQRRRSASDVAAATAKYGLAIDAAPPWTR
jgi:pyruvate dehydrogenase E1 component